MKREKLEDWSRRCAIHIFCQLHCAENTCDVTQSGCNWTGSTSQSSPSAAEKSTLTKNLIPETQSAQTNKNLWASRAHCQYGSYLSERLLCLTNVCLSGDGKFYRGFSKLSLLWGLKAAFQLFPSLPGIIAVSSARSINHFEAASVVLQVCLCFSLTSHWTYLNPQIEIQLHLILYR